MNQLWRVCFVALMACALGSFSTAAASELPLTLAAAPRIEISNASVDYSLSTHLFRVNGVAGSLETPPADDPPDYAIDNGFTSISLTISTSGAIIGPSTLSIGGTIASIGVTPSPLVTGNAINWGYPNAPGGNNFQFEFSVTGGKLSELGCGAGAATPCFPVNATIDVIVRTFGNAFPGTFTSNYSNTNNANNASAATPAPEPASIALVGFAAALLLTRRRPRR